MLIAVPIKEWIVTSKYVNGTNVLGLVFHSLLLGVAIGQLKIEEGKPLSNFCTSFADTMLIIMTWITKYVAYYIILLKQSTSCIVKLQSEN